MAHVEYETQGWFSRIGSSIKGIFGGIAIFLLAIPLIFWNECSAVDRARDLETGRGSVIAAKADTVSPKNEGALVHVVGDVKVDETLSDPLFGISVKGLSLERKVEMYQWKENQKKEKKKKVGGKEETKTTYTYEKAWSSSAISSSNFKEEDKVNPGPLPYKGETFAAKNATLGSFALSPGITSSLGTSSKIMLTDADLKKASDLKSKDAKVHDGMFYLGKSPTSPTIGDTRITYTVRKPGLATVIAGQYGSELREWKHKNLNGSLVLTANGKKTPDELFSAAESANTIKTWVLRLVTFLMMFGGLSAVFKPLSVLADVIPFLGTLVGKAFALVAFLLSAPIWLFCVALAWFVARPLVGILLLVGAALFMGGLIFVFIKARGRRAAAT